jgi:hypothetical protein
LKTGFDDIFEAKAKASQRVGKWGSGEVGEQARVRGEGGQELTRMDEGKR